MLVFSNFHCNISFVLLEHLGRLATGSPGKCYNFQLSLWNWCLDPCDRHRLWHTKASTYFWLSLPPNLTTWEWTWLGPAVCLPECTLGFREAEHEVEQHIPASPPPAALGLPQNFNVRQEKLPWIFSLQRIPGIFQGWEFLLLRMKTQVPAI